MREIKIKSVYKHFKGNYYLVEDIGTSSETEEPLVIYRALYGSNKLWVRPLKSFVSEVDKEKYPNANQQYRFELTEIESVTK